MPPESVMTLLSFLVHSERSFSTFSICAGSGGLPNSPRLKDTVFHTDSNASVVNSCGTSPIRLRAARASLRMSWPPTVIVPLVAPTAAAGALLIFLTAFNELTLSALLWSSGSETLGVVFFSFQQGGDSTYAAALGVLTVIVSVVLMLSTLLAAKRLPQGVLPWRD